MRSTRAAPNMGSGVAADARRNRQRKSRPTSQNTAFKISSLEGTRPRSSGRLLPPAIHQPHLRGEHSWESILI